MAALWSRDVIEAVERWVAVTAEPGRGATWSDLGAAIPRDDGRLVLHLRGDESSPDAFVDLCVVGEHGPERERVYPVEEFRAEDGVLVVRAPPGLPEQSRHLWVRSPRFLLEKLLEGLRAAGPAPLAKALAEQRLAGPPTSRAEADGLSEEQVEAFRACLSPGVRLVRGPPDPGTTQVLARAIQELVRSGKRVLLVSPSDVAVDDALHAVVRRMSPRPGAMIRVGPAQRAEIAGHPDIQLERLAARASREIDEQRDAVAAQLRTIEEVEVRIAQLRAELGDYDEAAYSAAVARLAAQRQVEELRPRLREAESAADESRRAVVTAATGLREAFAARAELDPVRDALDHERGAVAGLAALEERQHALQIARDTLEAREPSTGWRARRQHRSEVDAAEAELRRFVAAAAAGRRRWLDVQLQARSIIGEHSQADVDRVDQRVAEAEDAVATADEEYRRCREVVNGLRRAIDEAEARGRPTDDDRRLVADGEARALPARHAWLRELLGWQHDTAERRGPLEAHHRELVDRAHALRANAAAEAVRAARVVATTLATSRVHPGLVDASFDVVLVDEAGAAPLAEVLLVLSRATTTAVLFGDVEQPGPVQGQATQDDPDPALERWVRATCFSHADPDARVPTGSAATNGTIVGRATAGRP